MHLKRWYLAGHLAPRSDHFFKVICKIPDQDPPLYTKGRIQTPKVDLLAGDFWLNVYSDALSVGNDLLTGNGIAKFVALRALEKKLREDGHNYDYVMIDLPPSFGGLVRSALYSSDYLVIPCTSDTFSEYCIGLISQMLPQFINDWDNGIREDLKLTTMDQLNMIISVNQNMRVGYSMDSIQGLRRCFERIKLITKILKPQIQILRRIVTKLSKYNPVRSATNYNMGTVEDMNVLIQNSLWQNIPASKLSAHQQVKNLSGDKQKWSEAQLDLIGKIKTQVDNIADKMITEL